MSYRRVQEKQKATNYCTRSLVTVRASGVKQTRNTTKKDFISPANFQALALSGIFNSLNFQQRHTCVNNSSFDPTLLQNVERRKQRVEKLESELNSAYQSPKDHYRNVYLCWTIVSTGIWLIYIFSRSFKYLTFNRPIWS